MKKRTAVVLLAAVMLTACSSNATGTGNTALTDAAVSGESGGSNSNSTVSGDSSAADGTGSGASGNENESGTEGSTDSEGSRNAGTADEGNDSASYVHPSDESPLDVPEGQYLSELTGLPIDEDLRMQRPIAVMVDNESKALPHYGTADADIVYELMNSTANDRITRLMCIYKDWEDLDQVGSIRSTRPTNILLGQEYDAVICHDGGPYYIDSWLEKYPYHFSGTFSRVNNGKAREFTEYILPGDLDRNFRNSGYSKEYSEDYLDDMLTDVNTGSSEKKYVSTIRNSGSAGQENGTNSTSQTGGSRSSSNKGTEAGDSKPSVNIFHFADYGTTTDLDKWDADGVRTANHIILPFPHNSSELHYNEETKTYDYYEYGEQHLDAETGKPLTFTNVLLQNCTFSQLDQNGYLIYNCISGYELCYYCTEGYDISCLWAKTSEGGRTRYYDVNHNEITINPGKTYVSLIPSDSFDRVQIY